MNVVVTTMVLVVFAAKLAGFSLIVNLVITIFIMISMIIIMIMIK